MTSPRVYLDAYLSGKSFYKKYSKEHAAGKASAIL